MKSQRNKMIVRNFSIALLFLLQSTISYSQTEKGTFALSGKTDLNFLFSNITTGTDSIDYGKTKSNQYGFTIGSGYFIANNILIALSGAYSYTDNIIEVGPGNPQRREIVTSALGLIPQLSYYIPLQGKLRPSISFGAGYVWLRERDSRVGVNDHVVYSLKGPSFNGAAGLSYFITKAVSFDLGLQFTHNRLKEKTRPGEMQKQNIVAGAFGVSVFL